MQNKNHKKIKQNIELKKPSEMCQVIYYSDLNKGEFASLTPMQVDLINTMFYLISEIIETQNLTEDRIYEWVSTNHFEINLQSVIEILGRYDNRYYEPIVESLQELSKIQVLTNVLHKNKAKESILFHFLRKISWVKHKQTTSKKVKVWIEPELLIMILNIKKYYSILSLQIQFSLKSKYSKLLYELMKDYIETNEKHIAFDILLSILNIDVGTKPEYLKWSIFNRDVLKRCIKEINEKTDIHLDYTPIKERIDKKLQVTSIKFTIKKQKSILVDYSKEPKIIDINEAISTNQEDIIIDSHMDLIDQKYYEIAEKQMQKIKEFGTIIKNERKYMEKIIENLKKDNIDVVGMLEVDNILTKLKSLYNKTSSHQLLVFTDFDNKPAIAISNDYLLYSPIDSSVISKTIKETINKINSFLESGGKTKIIETNNKINELEISYL